MKKLFILLAFLFVVLGTQAQSVYTATSDTVKGNETIYITLKTIRTSVEASVITTKFTEIGGTSDGTVTLEGYNGVGWVDLSGPTTTEITGFPTDSVTISDGGTAAYIINGSYFNSYRLKIAGTANDTTAIQADITPRK